MGLCANNIFFSSFKMALKVYFLSESRSEKFYKTKFNFKSIDNNFKIDANLFYDVRGILRDICKKVIFLTFFTNQNQNT
jgi:hypothetical protein